VTYASYQIGIVASAGSLALLLGAWAFQAIGYAPCAMCIWQRYPHGIAIFVGLAVLFGLRHKVVYFIGAVAAATTSGIGLYHTGVERDWWEGPTSCTGTGLDLSTMSAGDLLSTSGLSNLVMCDQVAWEFLSLSMASWNAVFSFVLAGLWIVALLHREGTQLNANLS
jgi:disulfide bond formation protein DsbB